MLSSSKTPFWGDQKPKVDDQSSPSQLKCCETTNHTLKKNCNVSRKNILACLFSVHEISLSQHGQVCLMKLSSERYFFHNGAM